MGGEASGDEEGPLLLPGPLVLLLDLFLLPLQLGPLVLLARSPAIEGQGHSIGPGRGQSMQSCQVWVHGIRRREDDMREVEWHV